MNLEKSCYSFIGCVIAGTIIQGNYNWGLGHMIIISLVLWSGCMVTQFLCENKRTLNQNFADEKKKKILEEEVEKIISALYKELKGQTEVFVEELSRNNEEWLNQMIDLHEKESKERAELGNDFLTLLQEQKISLSELIDTYKLRTEKLENKFDDEVQKLSEEIKSFKAKMEEGNMKTDTILENIQGATGNLQDAVSNLKISEIYNVSNGIYEKLEDVKSEISDSKDSITEKLSDMSEELGRNVDSEIKIIDEQSAIVERYDELISKLHDEVVVNIINDSNNMINCLNDCYNLLESIRKARR